MNSNPIILEEFAVIYSLPNSYDFFLLTPGEGQACFKISDFNGTNYELRGKLEPAELEDINSIELHFNSAVEETSFEDYSDTFIQSFGKLSTGELEKIILSRIKLIPFNSKQILNYLFYLKASNPNAFTYLITSPKTGTWLGATPEKLVEKSADGYKTMALAGTKVYEKDIAPEWTPKEIHEHEIVADEIEFVLKSIHATYQRGERSNSRSGQVQHLKTPFDFQTDRIAEFISELHPSPAISGKPKKEAISSIKAFEKHSRELYTGYLGIENQGDVHYFVNLRCMQVFKDSAGLYLGGGIIKDSILEDEWNETEHKAKSLLLPLEKMQKFAGNDF